MVGDRAEEDVAAGGKADGQLAELARSDERADGWGRVCCSTAHRDVVVVLTDVFELEANGSGMHDVATRVQPKLVRKDENVRRCRGERDHVTKGYRPGGRTCLANR